MSFDEKIRAMNRIAKLGGGTICMVVLCLLGIFGLIGFIYVDSHVYAGKTEHVNSPDGSAVAYVRLNEMTAGPDEYDVRIRKRYSPFRQSLFSAQTYGAKLKVRWVDSNHLVVSCDRCQDLSPFEARTELNGISVIYSPNIFK
jgi:hypothetical protein